MVTYLSHDGASAAPLLQDLVDLYAAVYSEPPYQEGPAEVERFRTTLPAELDRPGFRLISAHDDQDLVGAAYGWTMTAGTWWSRADESPPASLRDVDKLAVMEWIVRPSHRGQGIGNNLLDRLITQRPEDFATLNSDPRSVARKIYERSGWRQVARSTLPWGPPMDILVLDIADRQGRFRR
ncbi:GNAT family N-acetyltransferase [Actinoplanes sp. M2I2]|uniref:GNAT family N-acetyltransferase n=1 Tax=Actinoplanes sp. M2I2 TaxID=1734444 RepID=UPI0020225F85|nr:GNAT family N-acetyltransferase [Actinoplanes sp. M2I2]